MIPVDQDMFYDASVPTERQRGNCWTACIASLLEVPLAEVPNFVQIEEDGGQPWWNHTLDYLRDHGHRLKGLAHGDEPPGQHYIATGISPRGDGTVRHAVIYLDGELAHDPHFSRDGILNYESIYAVVPADG